MAMADNKTKKGRKEAVRVDSIGANEIEYLHRQHPGMSQQQIKDIIARYGPMRQNILRHLPS
jgi:hypothetical protein